MGKIDIPRKELVVASFILPAILSHAAKLHPHHCPSASDQSRREYLEACRDRCRSETVRHFFQEGASGTSYQRQMAYDKAFSSIYGVEVDGRYVTLSRLQMLRHEYAYGARLTMRTCPAGSSLPTPIRWPPSISPRGSKDTDGWNPLPVRSGRSGQ